MNRCASQANSAASTCPGRCRAARGVSHRARRAAGRPGAASVRALQAPPPQTSSSAGRHAGQIAEIAAAMVTAVYSHSVACTSATLARCTVQRASAATARWNSSRPVLLGGGSGEVGFLQQQVAAVRACTLPDGGKRAIPVKGCAQVFAGPQVHQAIARPGVEAADTGHRRRSSVILRDAADVHHHARFAGRAEGRGMEGRHQRRRLTAGRHVAAPEVGDHVDAGALGDAVGIADLQREGQWRARGRCSTVCPWLPMARTCAAAHAGDLQQLQGRVANTSPTSASSAPSSSRSQLCGFATARLQPLRQRLRGSPGAGRRAICKPCGVDLQQHGFDAVHAGAGDQAGIERHGAPRSG